MGETDRAREYLVDFMVHHFRDKSFGPYIHNDLAGDFAYQLSAALEKITSNNSQSTPCCPNLTKCEDGVWRCGPLL